MSSKGKAIISDYSRTIAVDSPNLLGCLLSDMRETNKSQTAVVGLSLLPTGKGAEIPAATRSGVDVKTGLPWFEGSWRLVPLSSLVVLLDLRSATF